MASEARRRGGAVLVAAMMLVVGTLSGVRPAAAASDSLGADFWLAFNANLGTPELSLFLTGDTATNGMVEIPGLGFSAPFSVTPGTVTTVAIPAGAAVTPVDGTEDKGIHVTADDEVTVYGLNRVPFTTDAFLGLPTDILGTEYVVLGYENVGVVNATQFAVVGTQDGTSVTITPSVTTGARTAGVPYVIPLNQGEVYQLRNTGPAPNDLSGTIVTADQPVAVFGGHQCANIPAGSFACDHLVEQLFPTATWGQEFATMPLATRTGGDTFRFVAGTDNTTVSVNGAPVATLDRGDLHEQIVTGPAHITASEPIMVAQYSNSSTFDGVANSDPFQMLVPPLEQFLASYTVTTPASGFDDNFVNVVAPAAAVGAVDLDGAPIPAASFTPIGASGFSGAQVPVSIGSHTLSSAQPFGVGVYGYADFDSYGYPGGLSLAPIATVSSLTVGPKTAQNPLDTQHCVTATALDDDGLPVEGVRVDFVVTGANPTTGFAFTDANGEAEFCYTGTVAGDDTITATVGLLSDTATKTWGRSNPCEERPDPNDPPPGFNVIMGTPGNDLLTGTAGADLIVGLGGHDHLVGLGGDDILLGDDGNDRLEGGDGNDFLCAGSGNDRLEGGEGNDHLAGDAGFDELLGGPGDDTLEGGTEHDRLDGGPGEDTLDGGPGADSCINGAAVNCSP